MKEVRVVRSLDVDDTLAKRQLLARQVGLLGFRSMQRGQIHIPDNLDAISRSFHDPEPSYKNSRADNFYLKAHSRRQLIPGVREALFTAHRMQENSVNIANSGRHTDEQWVRMNRDFLERNGINSLIAQDFYKPKNQTSTESKADVLRAILEGQYKDIYDPETQEIQLEHYDDDPRTAIILAHLFPQMTVYLVEQEVTKGIIPPLSELAELANLHIVSHIREGLFAATL